MAGTPPGYIRHGSRNPPDIARRISMGRRVTVPQPSARTSRGDPMVDLMTHADPAAAAARYQAVRARTEQLAAPLSAEDQTVQSMPDVSPTKWHRAHTTWFFETFMLQPGLGGYRLYEPVFAYLFNSYYESVGDRYPRPMRGVISRPGIGEVSAYRDYVDEAMGE